MIKVKYVSRKKLYPASAIAIFKTETIYINKDLPKLAQKFLIEHEKFHIWDNKRLGKKGKKETLFWCELKAYVYAFFKQPLGGFVAIIRNLTPKKIVSFVKLYFKDNDKTINKIIKNLR